MPTRKRRRKTTAEKLADWLLTARSWRGVSQGNHLLVVDVGNKQISQLHYTDLIAAIRKFYPEDECLQKTCR